MAAAEVPPNNLLLSKRMMKQSSKKFKWFVALLVIGPLTFVLNDLKVATSSVIVLPVNKDDTPTIQRVETLPTTKTDDLPTTTKIRVERMSPNSDSLADATGPKIKNSVPLPVPGPVIRKRQGKSKADSTLKTTPSNKTNSPIMTIPSNATDFTPKAVHQSFTSSNSANPQGVSTPNSVVNVSSSAAAIPPTVVTVAAMATAAFNNQTEERPKTPLPPAPLHETKNQTASDPPLFLTQIVQNRHLINPGNNRTLRLLQQILENDDQNPYNTTTDILVFEHAMKSGGTSLSKMLDTAFHTGVVPGSAHSDFYSTREYWEFMENYTTNTPTRRRRSGVSHNNTTTTIAWKSTQRPNMTTAMADAIADYWQNHAKVVYSHGIINQHPEFKGKQKKGAKDPVTELAGGPSGMEAFLQDQLNATRNLPGMTVHRKFRVLSMIRDPVPFVGSNMAEWMCGIAGKLRLAQTLGYHNGKLDVDIHLYNKTATTSATLHLKRSEPCFGLTMTNLHDIWIKHQVVPTCQDRTQWKKHGKLKCQQFIEQGVLPMLHCRSAKHMLDTPNVFQMVHDSNKGLIPLDIYVKYNNNDNNNKDTKGNDKSSNTTITPTNNHTTSADQKRQQQQQQQQQQEQQASRTMIEEYEYQAMLRLGGLSAQYQSYMMWFGIPERMEESMCLFHFMARIEFPKSIPSARHKTCRPISYWNDEDIVTLQQREVLGYAVARVAHAILDARVAKMCRTLQGAASNEYAYLNLPDSCCVNFVVDQVTGGLIHHEPSKIF